jgi:hypothetical protein
MAFLEPIDTLVLEKDGDTVKRVLNHKMLQKQLRNVNVANAMKKDAGNGCIKEFK